MKLPKDDISLLFSPKLAETAAQALPATSGVEPPVRQAPQSPAADKPPARESPFAVAALLRRIAPALWRKLDPRLLSKRDLRAQMLMKLQWLAQKQLLSLEVGAPCGYLSRTGRVEGRLFALLRQAQYGTAVELCFEPDEPALLKLRAAYDAGGTPVLLWAGPSAPPAELLPKLLRHTPFNSLSWLTVVQLNQP